VFQSSLTTLPRLMGSTKTSTNRTLRIAFMSVKGLRTLKDHWPSRFSKLRPLIDEGQKTDERSPISRAQRAIGSAPLRGKKQTLASKIKAGGQ
jgi:hypothetical protein